MHEATMTRRSLIAGASLAAGALGIASGVTLAKADEAATDEAWDLETDVVVIGFGGSGAASAIGAADGGANVILLEKLLKNSAVVIHQYVVVPPFIPMIMIWKVSVNLSRCKCLVP